ncbi:hypothetical protein OOT46_27555 [Aquabacterium sp. A7-Y]|uniref:hypothetical protein n=1 Tax=Aquabacterium sp. A7-Y TaxID=1349605 RepID=UPI00223E4C20|nr:hypothetical protein [Aquabacterium sp. A7-Y]MCW7541566.1 hypothetical protein [Aquabacterium sp. A7-Y]
MKDKDFSSAARAADESGMAALQGDEPRNLSFLKGRIGPSRAKDAGIGASGPPVQRERKKLAQDCLRDEQRQRAARASLHDSVGRSGSTAVGQKALELTDEGVPRGCLPLGGELSNLVFPDGYVFKSVFVFQPGIEAAREPLVLRVQPSMEAASKVKTLDDSAPVCLNTRRPRGSYP